MGPPRVLSCPQNVDNCFNLFLIHYVASSYESYGWIDIVDHSRFMGTFPHFSMTTR